MEKVFNKVILVDDDDVSNYLTSKIITNLDIAEDLVIHKNGMQALEFFKEHSDGDLQKVKKPDLVILDINMAIVNGFELLEALSLTNYLDNTKVVILSSSQDPNDRDIAAQYRINGYLTKPLEASKLKEIIKDIFHDQTKIIRIAVEAPVVRPVRSWQSAFDRGRNGSGANGHPAQ